MPQAARVSPSLLNTRLVFNMRSPKFADMRIRRALSLALDREMIAEKILRMGEAPAYTIVPAIPGYDAANLDFRAKPMAARLNEARTLLAAAGFSIDKPLSLVLRQRIGVAHNRVAIAIANMWAQVGVKTEIRNTDIATHYGDLAVQNYDVAVTAATWFASPEPFLADFMPGSGQNYTAYHSKTYIAAFKRAAAISNRGQRYAAFAEAEAILLNDVPVIPLYCNVNAWLVSPKLKGFADNISNVHPSSALWFETSR